MAPFDSPRPIHMVRDELRGGLPYPLSDEELDGLHMKESMKDSHRVRQVPPAGEVQAGGQNLSPALSHWPCGYRLREIGKPSTKGEQSSLTTPSSSTSTTGPASLPSTRSQDTRSAASSTSSRS